MQDLRTKLEKYAKAYEEGNPLISDAEYDKLHTEYKNKGGEPITMITKGTLKHKVPMSSMADTFTMEDALAKVSKPPYHTNHYIIEPKWDGVSGSFVYSEGKLVQGLTRGDGKTGNPIINYDEIINLPSTIPTLNDVIVRGELIIKKSNFDYEKMSNPRNTVAGAIRKEEKGSIKNLKIEFIPWDVIFEAISKHSDIHQWLEMNGFESKYTPSVNLEEAFELMSASQHKAEYDMDGLVIKINDKKIANKLGMGSKYSNYMFALKFKDAEYTSEVIDVAWQMGMNGMFTPVLKIKPVLINGVEVTSVTIHNINQLKKARAGIGSVIRLIRSGDVIPKYIGTIKESLDCKRPDVCPHCSGMLIVTRVGDKVPQLFCVNDHCTEKTKLKLVHFTKRGYLDIKGLSKESIDKLYDKGYLRTYPDLFKLTVEQLTEVLGKNGIKIHQRILDMKGLSMELLLGSIPMPNGGRTVWKKITRDMTYREMLKVKGIGEETAASVTKYLHLNKDMIDELISLANPTEPIVATVTYGISGTIPGGRTALIKKLETIGWRKTSGKADFFIAGEGALLKKAKGKVIKVEEIPWDEV